MPAPTQTPYDTVAALLAQALLLAIGIALGWAVQLLRRIASRVHGPPGPVRAEQSAWVDNRVHEHLTVLRERLGPDAQRAYVSRYHNGDHFVPDDSALIKKTRTHEVVRDGVAYQDAFFKSLLISTIPDELTLVMQAGPSFTRVRDLPAGKFKWLMMQGGAVAVARCGMYKLIGGKRHLVGFVGVDFDSDVSPDAATLAMICETAGRIEQFL